MYRTLETSFSLVARSQGGRGLTQSELDVLVLLKRERKKTNEAVLDAPTIAEAVRWIAELGGYTGKSSGGPPGSITVARGLERLMFAADVFDSSKKLR